MFTLTAICGFHVLREVLHLNFFSRNWVDSCYYMNAGKKYILPMPQVLVLCIYIPICVTWFAAHMQWSFSQLLYWLIQISEWPLYRAALKNWMSLLMWHDTCTPISLVSPPHTSIVMEWFSQSFLTAKIVTNSHVCKYYFLITHPHPTTTTLLQSFQKNKMFLELTLC